MTNSRIAYKVLAASIAAVVISGCSDQGQITVTLPNIQATPTAAPTPSPTATPTTVVSVQPTSQPSATTVVTSRPTSQPSATAVVTSQPTAQPTAIPTAQPTTAPVACDAPDFDAAVWTSYQLGDLVTYQGVVYELYEMGQQYQPPSSAYGQISWRVASDCGVAQPTVVPTSAPTAIPTTAPTTEPSVTVAPTAEPTTAPTAAPTGTATLVPSVTPSVTPTAAPTVTSVVTPTPTPIVTDLPAGSCPTSNWKSGDAYQAGSEVYYQGTIFTASAYMSAGIEPQKDFVPEGQYSKPPYWITQGPVDPNWCAGLAIDTSGRVLDTSGWPHPMKRLWTDYDNASGKHIGAYFVEWGVYGLSLIHI